MYLHIPHMWSIKIQIFPETTRYPTCISWSAISPVQILQVDTESTAFLSALGLTCKELSEASSHRIYHTTSLPFTQGVETAPQQGMTQQS